MAITRSTATPDGPNGRRWAQPPPQPLGAACAVIELQSEGGAAGSAWCPAGGRRWPPLSPRRRGCADAAQPLQKSRVTHATLWIGLKGFGGPAFSIFVTRDVMATRGTVAPCSARARAGAGDFAADRHRRQPARRLPFLHFFDASDLPEIQRVEAASMTACCTPCCPRSWWPPTAAAASPPTPG